MSDLTMQNQSLAATRRKLEQEADNLRQDCEDMRGRLRITFDRIEGSCKEC